MRANRKGLQPDPQQRNVPLTKDVVKLLARIKTGFIQSRTGLPPVMQEVELRLSLTRMTCRADLRDRQTAILAEQLA